MAGGLDGLESRRARGGPETGRRSWAEERGSEASGGAAAGGGLLGSHRRRDDAPACPREHVRGARSAQGALCGLLSAPTHRCDHRGPGWPIGAADRLRSGHRPGRAVLPTAAEICERRRGAHTCTQLRQRDMSTGHGRLPGGAHCNRRGDLARLSRRGARPRHLGGPPARRARRARAAPPRRAGHGRRRGRGPRNPARTCSRAADRLTAPRRSYLVGAPSLS